MDAVGDNKSKYIKVLSRFFTEAFVNGDLNTVKDLMFKFETNLFYKEVFRIINEKNDEEIYHYLFNAFIKSRLKTHEAFSQV